MRFPIEKPKHMSNSTHLTTTKNWNCPCIHGSQYCYCCQNNKINRNINKDCPCECGRLVKDCCVALVKA